MAWIFTNNTQFYLHDAETLLQGMLRSKIPANHQCLEGYCGTCKLKYRRRHHDTRIDYIHPPLVMLDDDEILPCCCQVRGAIELDIDWFTKITRQKLREIPHEAKTYPLCL